MCGGQACMGKAPIGIAAPYMAGRSGEAAATLAELAKPTPQACCVYRCDVNYGEGALGNWRRLYRILFARRDGTVCICVGRRADASNYG